MANEFRVSCPVTDTDIADAMLNDAELFACVFHEISEQIGKRPIAEMLDEAVDQMSKEARAFVRELAGEIDRVDAKP
ncbi:MAG: hypothetical protein HEQ16_05145 [Bosea sp.]|jgi:hypothetical protein|nr:hypothetical protein [Bosea sp. (in: a-proteobacteria)]